MIHCPRSNPQVRGTSWMDRPANRTWPHSQQNRMGCVERRNNQVMVWSTAKLQWADSTYGSGSSKSTIIDSCNSTQTGLIRLGQRGDPVFSPSWRGEDFDIKTEKIWGSGYNLVWLGTESREYNTKSGYRTTLANTEPTENRRPSGLF